MSRRLESRRGASIIQILVVSAMMALFATVILYLNQVSQKIQSNTSVLTTVQSIRSNLMAVLLNRSAFEKTLAMDYNAANNMNAVRVQCFLAYMSKKNRDAIIGVNPTPTKCDAIPAISGSKVQCPWEAAGTNCYLPPFSAAGVAQNPLKLYTPGESVFYDSSIANHGFTLEGTSDCFPYGTGTCAIRYELSWGLQCTPTTGNSCPCPAMLVTGTVSYSSADDRKAMNAYKLGIGPNLKIPLDSWCK